MTTVRNLITKVALWLLAILVPVQPVLSFDCPCNCQAGAESKAEESTASDDQSSNGPCCSHCHQCCRESKTSAQRLSTKKLEPSGVRRPTRATVSIFLLGLRTCHCGDDCDCQIRHELRPGMVEGKVANAELEVSLPSALTTMDLPDLVAVGSTAGEFPGLRAAACAYSALEVCAHLCRFTI